MKMNKPSEAKTIDINAHTIEYRWDDGKEREIDKTDKKLILRLLKMSLVEGELNQYDHKTEEVATGWWVLSTKTLQRMVS